MRHGNTFEEGQTPFQIGARTDLPLTAWGRKQAEKMGAFLLAHHLDPFAIFSGSLKRQKQSAEIIGNQFKIIAEEEPALNEIDYGLWEGLTAQQIQEGWPRESAAWAEGQWPAEIFNRSAESYLQKIQEWIHRISQEGEKTFFAVTSNGLLRFFQNQKVKTGHFCELWVENGRWEVKSWNCDPFRELAF